MINKVLCGGILVCLLGGCSSEAADDILGTWYEVGDTEVMQFFKDGTMQVYDGIQMTGKYSFPEDNFIRIEYDGIGALAGPQIYGYSLDDDLLIVTNPDGRSAMYTRTEADARPNSAGQPAANSSVNNGAVGKIEGSWRVDGLPATWDFAADHTFSVTLDIGKTLTGTYQLVGSQDMMIKHDSSKNGDWVTYSVAGGVLTIRGRDDPQDVTVLRKID